MNIQQRTSPNRNTRPEGTEIDCIVLHADASTNEQGTLSWLSIAASKVSYHYLVGRDGTIYQIVPDHKRAWHAGKSSFQGRADCNDYSIGVSFSNDQKGERFTPLAIEAGTQLLVELCKTYRIPTHRITTHAVVSPGRKFDPGPLFPVIEVREEVRARLGVQVPLHDEG
jgi:N-acetylmuramoyl-L-alanine amidase